MRVLNLVHALALAVVLRDERSKPMQLPLIRAQRVHRCPALVGQHGQILVHQRGQRHIDAGGQPTHAISLREPARGTRRSPALFS